MKKDVCICLLHGLAQPLCASTLTINFEPKTGKNIMDKDYYSERVRQQTGKN